MTRYDIWSQRWLNEVKQEPQRLRPTRSGETTHEPDRPHHLNPNIARLPSDGVSCTVKLRGEHQSSVSDDDMPKTVTYIRGLDAYNVRVEPYRLRIRPLLRISPPVTPHLCTPFTTSMHPPRHIYAPVTPHHPSEKALWLVRGLCACRSCSDRYHWREPVHGRESGTIGTESTRLTTGCTKAVRCTVWRCR